VSQLQLPPTALPLNDDLRNFRPSTNEELVKDLASLKYPGFSHVRPSRQKNPVSVLLKALGAEDLEARLVEALPWLLLSFSDMQWTQLVEAAKVKDLQNRLGFLTALARQLARRRSAAEQEKVFEHREKELLNSKLAKLDTLCHASMTNAERDWLMRHRSADARRWNMLTDLDAAHLSYA
jgi:hypothetical protein